MKKFLNKKSIINIVIGFMFFNLFINATVYNDVNASTKISESEKYENSILIADTSADEMWRSASNWFKGVDTNNNSDQAKKIVSEFSSIINVVGTTVIVIATIFLGVKYIIGSVESKTEVKESLITLLIACLFFFGWNEISNILVPGGKLIWSSTDDTSYKQMVGRVFNTVVFVLNIAAVIAIIYVGIKYIFSGASGKAELKGRSPYFIIGIILTFCSVALLNFVSKVINEIIVGG